MMTLTGIALVLVTWAFAACVVVALGLPVASWTAPEADRQQLVRRALWWGALIAALMVGVLSVLVPMRSPVAAWALVIVACAGGVLGYPSLRRRSRAAGAEARPAVVALVPLGLAQVYLALAALGPVTGYDTGLYHLGAVKYSANFAAIPGLANLYAPLGYGSMQFPLAALLDNGPWSDQGYRLFNGLLLGLVAADFCLRIFRRRWSVGTYIMLVGLTAAWVPMIALSDFWVTSPSQDSAVLVLTVVAISYLSDAIAAARNWTADASIACIVAITTWMIRPTMAIFVACVIAVCLAIFFIQTRRGVQHRPRVAAIGVAGAGLLAVAVSGMRDYRLSGWLQYPLSIHAFNVPWLAPNPTSLREVTLGFARDPANMWQSAHGWAWIPAWISRLPHQWETFEILVLALVMICLLLVCRDRSGNARTALEARSVQDTRNLRGVVLASIPCVVTVAFWWLFTPPSFRFAWGPLFMLFAVPIGWCLWVLSADPRRRIAWPRSAEIPAMAAIVLVVLISFIARSHLSTRTQAQRWTLGVSIPYAVSPVQQVPVSAQRLASGVVVTVPVGTDQCWLHFPLCTPQPSKTLRMRGTDLQQGFLP